MSSKRHIAYQVTEAISKIVEHKESKFFTESKENTGNPNSRTQNFSDELEAITEVIQRAQLLSDLKQDKYLRFSISDIEILLEAAKEIYNTLNKMEAFHKDAEISNQIPEETESKKEFLVNRFFNAKEIFIDLTSNLALEQKNQYAIRDLQEGIKFIQKQTTSEAIEKFSGEQFQPQTKQHKRAATQWLIASVVSYLISGSIALYILIPLQKLFTQLTVIDEPEKIYISPPLLIATIVAKAIILSVAFSFNVWATNNYKRNKHNELKNIQKELSLSTFNQIMTGAGTEENKTMILDKVTTVLFNDHDFGYIKDETLKTDNIVELLKLIRASDTK